MKDRLPQMMRRAQNYTNLEDLGTDKEHVAWWWKVIALLSSWLIVGGFLVLPSTFDSDDGYKVNKTALTVLGIVLVAAGFCCTFVVHFAIRNWLFRVDSIYFPAFTSSLVGLLTVVYSFVVQDRYKWNLAAKLTIAFAGTTTILYGLLIIYTQRQIAAIKHLPKPRHIPLQSASYEESRTEVAPSLRSRPSLPNLGEGPDPLEDTFRSNYLTNMYPMLGNSSPAKPNSPHDADSIISERPPAPPINGPPPDRTMLTEEELTRQQMLMLLLSRPEPERPMDPSGQPLNPETSYRIDWHGSEELASPIAGPGQGPRPQFQSIAGAARVAPPNYNATRTPISPPSATAQTPGTAIPVSAITPHPNNTRSSPARAQSSSRARSQSRSQAQHTRVTSADEKTPGVPPPGYFERNWDGVWRTADDIPQDRLHPAFRESRFLRTGGGDRELRRLQIERGGPS